MSPLFEPKLDLRRLLAVHYRKPTIVILTAILVSVTFKYYGSKAFYLEHLAGSFVLSSSEQITAALYVFASAFILLGIIPALVIRFVFKERLATYGLSWGDVSFGLKAIAIVSPVMILASWSSASRPEFLAEYPLNPLAWQSTGGFLLHALSYLFFYAGWEFCFRGFVQFGLRDSMGDWNAILVQTALSCVVHIGKPAGEIYSSILGALIWGVLAFRSRSLAAPIATHWLLGLSLDFFIVTSI